MDDADHVNDDETPRVWRVGDPPLSGAPHLRLTSRKDPSSSRSWVIGVIMDLSGALIVSAPARRSGRADVIRGCIERVQRELLDLSYSGPLELSVRAKGFSPEQVTPTPGIPLVPLDPEETLQLAPASVEEVLRSLVADETEIARSARMTLWHRRMRTSPQMVFRHIDDQTCRTHELQTPAAPSRARLPVTVVVGLSGVGKSSLISALMGLAGEDLPPASTSRTTLCPISFRNTPDTQIYHLEVRFHPDREILRRVSDRLTDALETALREGRYPGDAFRSGSAEATPLARSPDSLFDLRFTLGRYDPGAEEWAETVRLLQELLRFARENGVSADEIYQFGLAEPVAKRVWGRIRHRINGLGFGDLLETAPGEFVFRYATRSRRAAIEAGRRFYAVGMPYAGKSFGPFCRRVVLSGPWISSPPFELVDNRGFDHEGSLDRVAGDDLVDEITAADRVLVVESAEKVGERQTMGLVARILADGEGEKVLFACTRGDIPLRRGVALEGHVATGLLNGLNTLDQSVGRNAVQVVRDTIRTHPPFLFGDLDQAFRLGEGGLLVAERDEEIDLDNASEAGRLIRLLSRETGSAPEEGGTETSLVFSEKKLRAALVAAWSEALDRCLTLYGPDDLTRGTLPWWTVKKEVRLVTRKVMELGEEVRMEDMALISEHAQAVSKAVSRLVDDPILPGEGGGAGQEEIARAGNRIRKGVRPVIEQAVIRRVLLSQLEDWVTARDYSMASYGPGSTLARAAMIRQILERASGERSALALIRGVGAGLLSAGAEFSGGVS